MKKENITKHSRHLVDDIIADGCEKARRVAHQTMAEVREAIKYNLKTAKKFAIADFKYKPFRTLKFYILEILLE